MKINCKQNFSFAFDIAPYFKFIFFHFMSHKSKNHISSAEKTSSAKTPTSSKTSPSSLDFFQPDLTENMELPISDDSVSAGFPSPAEDLMDKALDLNKALIKHPASTFYARVKGMSMMDEGIHEGDLLIIDKSINPTNGCLAVCYIDGEFTLKRVQIEKDCILLVPANPKFQPIRVTEDNDFLIWGIVQYVIKKV